MLRLCGCVCDHLHDALNNWTQSRLKEKLLQYLCVCDSVKNLVDIIKTYGCALQLARYGSSFETIHPLWQVWGQKQYCASWMWKRVHEDKS